MVLWEGNYGKFIILNRLFKMILINILKYIYCYYILNKYKNI